MTKLKKDQQYYKQLFFRFLKELGIYGEYMKCRIRSRISTTDNVFYFNRTYPDRFVFEAFTWSETKQKHYFWERIDDYWNEFYKYHSNYTILSKRRINEMYDTYKEAVKTYGYA